MNSFIHRAKTICSTLDGTDLENKPIKKWDIPVTMSTKSNTLKNVDVSLSKDIFSNNRKKMVPIVFWYI